ncbi:MAG: type II secretion system F family protein [Archangium sp.]
MKERLRRAWFRHPVVAFFRARKLIAFYRQLHSLIRAGVPLTTAFGQLQQYAPDDGIARGLAAVARDVRGGHSLGDAMRTHAALFDDAYVELIAFAEEAGKLQPVSQAIVEHLERVQKQRWKAVMGALWPAYLGAAFVFVGPLLGVSQSATSMASVGGAYFAGLVSSLLSAVGVVGALFSVPFVLAALNVETQWDRFVRGVPMIGAPVRQLAASRLVLGLSLASSSGLEVQRSIRIAARATGRPSIVADVEKAEASVRAGSTLTEAIAKLNVLDRTSLGSLSVAETTGTLDTTLEKLAQELEEQSQRAMRFLIIAVTALVAGVLLVKIVMGILGTLFGPIKKLYDAAGSGSLNG